MFDRLSINCLSGLAKVYVVIGVYEGNIVISIANYFAVSAITKKDCINIKDPTICVFTSAKTLSE